MQKKSLLALLLALMMLLSGCALVSVDTAKDNARVIVDVNGETVNKATISAAVQNTLAQNQYYNQLYSSYRMSGMFSTDEATVTSEVINSYVENLVSKQKAAELGLNELTEEEQAEVEATGKENYDSFIQSVIDTYMPGSKLEGDALIQAAEKYVADRSITTVDGRFSLEDFEQAAKDSKAVEKLQQYMIQDVTVSDEEVQAEYGARVEAAKTEYETNPDAYGVSRNNGSTLYYAPAGYRMVKHILIPFDTADQAAATEKQTALTAAQTALTDAQAALENAAEDADKDALQSAVTEAEQAVADAQAAYDEAAATTKANAKAKADEVYALAAAEGADFDALVTEYSTDSMPAEGYAIREGFASFVTEFTEGAMALQNVGDVSEPVESTYGYHIIQYASDVEEGAVALEDVQSVISSSLLSQKQNETSAATLAQWVSEANVKTYADRLN